MFNKFPQILNKKLLIRQVILISFFLILMTTILDISFYQGFLTKRLDFLSLVYKLFSKVLIIIPLIYVILKQKLLLDLEEEVCNSFFEYNKCPIFITDIEGHILTVNPSASKLLGYSEIDLIARHFASLLPKNELDKNFSALTQAFKGIYSNYCTVILTSNHIAINMNFTMLPIIMNENVIGIMILAHSIKNNLSVEKDN